jgi:hypothetical protein
MIVAAFLLCAVPAQAHGPAQWIQDGHYKNAVGELCCGERDCFELADADVKTRPDGYHVTLHPSGGDVVEVIPYSEATPSPDGKYWRCQWGGSRKCFFAPPPGS